MMLERRLENLLQAKLVAEAHCPIFDPNQGKRPTCKAKVTIALKSTFWFAVRFLEIFLRRVILCWNVLHSRSVLCGLIAAQNLNRHSVEKLISQHVNFKYAVSNNTSCQNPLS